MWKRRRSTLNEESRLTSRHNMGEEVHELTSPSTNLEEPLVLEILKRQDAFLEVRRGCCRVAACL